jgi:hypothetical protein
LLGNIEEMLIRRKEVGMEGNADKASDMFMYREQNLGHNHSIKKTFKILAKFRYKE